MIEAIDYKQRFEEFLTACGQNPMLASNPTEVVLAYAATVAAMTEQKSAVERAAEFGRYLATSATRLEDHISTVMFDIDESEADQLTDELMAVRRDVYEFEKRYQRYLAIAGK